MRPADFGLRVRRPHRGRAGDGAVEIAEQPMLGAALFLARRAGGKETQVAVDLACVGIDDDAVPAFGKRQCKRRLAACRRSCDRSEEQTSELQSLMRNPYAVFCLTQKKTRHKQ